MDVLSAIKNRKSTRAFIDKQVSPQTIQDVLDAARWAPSGANIQPPTVPPMPITNITPVRLKNLTSLDSDVAERRCMEH